MHTALMILVVLLGILALPVVAGVVYQAIGTWRDRRRFPPPGRLVRVNEGRMHIHVTGEGTPTVVFESGMGASCLSWTLVQPQFVLVGHSFGGYVNRAFAHLYRDEVAGMVLVDSLHPAEWKNPIPEQLRIIEMGLRYAWIAAWLARLGFVRFCLARLARGSPRMGRAAASAFGVGTASAVQRIAGEIRKLPAPILPIVRALWSQPKNFMSLGQHVAALPVSAVQAAAVSSLGDLSLVVLSGDHHAAPYIDWQRDLAQVSSCGLHLVASDSGHWIHLDHPELVTRAIREVVTAARPAAPMQVSAQNGWSSPETDHIHGSKIGCSKTPHQ